MFLNSRLRRLGPLGGLRIGRSRTLLLKPGTLKRKTPNRKPETNKPTSEGFDLSGPMLSLGRLDRRVRSGLYISGFAVEMRSLSFRALVRFEQFALKVRGLSLVLFRLQFQSFTISRSNFALRTRRNVRDSALTAGNFGFKPKLPT